MASLTSDKLTLGALIILIIGSIGIFLIFSDGLALIPLGVLLLVIGLRRWRDLVLLLPFLAAIAGWTIEVGGFGIRLDQALGLALSIIVCFSAVFGKLTLIKTRINTFVCLLLLSNIVSSTFSLQPGRSFIQLANIASSISIYFVVLNLVRSRQLYERFMFAMLAAGFAAMAYGLILLMLGLLGLDVRGVNIQEKVSGFGIYGSMREQNIFGSYSASMLLIGLTLYSTEISALRSRRKFLLVFNVTATMALFFSFARGAWVGAFVGLVALSLYRKRGIRILSPRLLSIVLVVIIVVVVVFSSGVVPSTIYSYKAENLFNFEEGTGLYRALIWVKGWGNFLDHPILGNGTYSYSYLNQEDTLYEGPGGGAWISNVFLLVLHDTGIVGMAVFFGFLWVVFRESRLSIQNAREQRLRSHAIGYEVAFLALLVAFQATSAFYYGYTWVIVGLIAVTRGLTIDNPEHS